jgi:chloramphenicol-sensitive protein RarD
MMKKGVFSAIAAYTLWGVFPIYINWLRGVAPFEILTHRILWAALLLGGVLTLKRDWSWLKPVLSNRRRLLSFWIAALLISTNWFTYIWAVNNGHVVDASLGYFINPLINVLLGVLFLSEKLRSGQWAAMLIAGFGVMYLTIHFGSIPWIALTLAITFGFYGLLKKISSLDALHGLSLETALISLPALGYLVIMESRGQAAFGQQGATITILLMFAGVMTAVPLLFYAMGAQSIPLYMMGILQYITPSFQFFLGILYFHEPFSPDRLVGYMIIWSALGVYTIESVLHRKTASRQRAKIPSIPKVSSGS